MTTAPSRSQAIGARELEERAQGEEAGTAATPVAASLSAPPGAPGAAAAEEAAGAAGDADPLGTRAFFSRLAEQHGEEAATAAFLAAAAPATARARAPDPWALAIIASCTQGAERRARGETDPSSAIALALDARIDASTDSLLARQPALDFWESEEGQKIMRGER